MPTRLEARFRRLGAAGCLLLLRRCPFLAHLASDARGHVRGRAWQRGLLAGRRVQLNGLPAGFEQLANLGAREVAVVDLRIEDLSRGNRRAVRRVAAEGYDGSDR